MAKKKKTSKELPLQGYIPANQPIAESITNPPNIAGVPTSRVPKGLVGFTNREGLSLGASTPNASYTSTPTTTDVDMVVNFIHFAVSSINSNGTTGGATLPTFTCLINSIPIFTLSLPVTCADSIGVVLNQIIDTTDFFLPKGSTIKMNCSADNTSGNGYRVNASFGITGASL